MSQGVDKLKELLFDSESQTLTDLQHQIERVAKTGTDQRAEIAKRVDAVFARSGTEERFRSSVATVLDGALRDAEIARHEALSDAVAPLVVRTIKREITNSRDELVEALYPMTGRMVKSYVASAIKDLTKQINRSLERNPFVLRINSLLTGRSVAELALADAQAIELDELFLIRRGTGELIARWPQDEQNANRDQVMSGILTAINDFAAEAFSADEATLRQIDLGDTQVYLRASQTHLLAAKCGGTATPPVEQILDEEFVSAIEALNDTKSVKEESAGNKTKTVPPPVPSTSSENISRGDTKRTISGPDTQDNQIATLAERLNTRFATYYSDHAPAANNASPVKLLLWIIGSVLALWLAWTLANTFFTQRTHAKALYMLDQTGGLAGYPINIKTGHYGATVTLDGLTPSLAIKHALLENMNGALSGTRVIDNLSVVKSGGIDHTSEIYGLDRRLDTINERVTKIDAGVSGLSTDLSGVNRNVSGNAQHIEAIDTRLLRQSLTHARSHIAASLPNIALLQSSITAPPANDKISGAQTRLAAMSPQLDKLGASLSAKEQPAGTRATLTKNLDALNQSLRQASNDLTNGLTLAAPNQRATSATSAFATLPDDASLAQRAQLLALNAQHLATISAAAAHTVMLREKSNQPTNRDILESWTRANAIFFSTGTDFASQRQAERKLRELISLTNNAQTMIRVVGYTDEKGQQASNTTLSLARARKVRDYLVSNGLSADLVVAVGRRDAHELSPTTGERSPNRRVQFELGFIGERAP